MYAEWQKAAGLHGGEDEEVVDTIVESRLRNGGIYGFSDPHAAEP